MGGEYYPLLNPVSRLDFPILKTDRERRLVIQLSLLLESLNRILKRYEFAQIRIIIPFSMRGQSIEHHITRLRFNSYRNCSIPTSPAILQTSSSNLNATRNILGHLLLLRYRLAYPISCLQCCEWVTATLYTLDPALAKLKSESADLAVFASAYLRNRLAYEAPTGDVEIYPNAVVNINGQQVEFDMYLPKFNIVLECKVFE